MVSLKYLSNFLRTFESSLIDYEINLIRTWSANCVLLSDASTNETTTFSLNDTKIYILFVILSTHDNPKQLQQMISYFKK